MQKVTDDILGINPPQVNPPPPPPPAPEQPDAMLAADRARRQREDADARGRRRGRASTVVTGSAGTSSGPVGMRTLVGS